MGRTQCPELFGQVCTFDVGESSHIACCVHVGNIKKSSTCVIVQVGIDVVRNWTCSGKELKETTVTR